MCLRSHKNCCAICTLIGVLLLIGIGLTIYFLYPRQPEIITHSPKFISSILTNNSIILQVSIDISVYSTNYIDIWISSIQTNFNTTWNLDDSILNGTGFLNGVTIYNHANTTFSLPLNITLPKPSKSVAINLLMTDSIVFKTVYHVVVTILIGWTNFNVVENGNVDHTISKDDLKKYLTSLL
ncbi:hypothetical protein BC833DRAFT_645823 [Globomyces pollinis-pini]|nr:hypothetical protein BC833DRAFT_645823 [Globomyces pollinis-pini]